tara:strand:- start:6 stop:212 length:207 start_codon:yes stop_codon:yes gene_type:complete
MRQLTLTNEEFDVLYDILQDTVNYIEDDLITNDKDPSLDDNGNEIEEKIEDYEAYHIYQKLINMQGQF